MSFKQTECEPKTFFKDLHNKCIKKEIPNIGQLQKRGWCQKEIPLYQNKRLNNYNEEIKNIA